MIKAITFDLDGVYFPNSCKETFMSKIADMGVSPQEVRRVFFQSDEMNLQYKLGKISDEEFWGWAAEEWKLDVSPVDLLTMLLDCYQPDAKVAETVRKVRATGYKTLVCSNNFPGRVKGLQERFGFLNDFDGTAFSYELGVDKPNREIFLALIDAAGVKAEEIVYSDDNADRLGGATELGINTFVYKDFDQFMSELSKLGVIV
jgi:putative hydrolase of the HAD superfamily